MEHNVLHSFIQKYRMAIRKIIDVTSTILLKINIDFYLLKIMHLIIIISLQIY